MALAHSNFFLYSNFCTVLIYFHSYLGNNYLPIFFFFERLFIPKTDMYMIFQIMIDCILLCWLFINLYVKVCRLKDVVLNKKWKMGKIIMEKLLIKHLISLIINIDWIFELWDRFLFFIIIILIDKRTLNFYQFMSCKHRYENRLMY